MPTFAQTDQLRRDLAGLTAAQKAAFRVAATKLVADLAAGSFRPDLRVRGVQGAPGVFEMTWADDGQATFEYGAVVHEGEIHVIWRRIGTHEVFTRP
jgi:hypothetical protein